MAADEGARGVAARAERDPEGLAAEALTRHGRALFAAALRVVGRPEDAEEVVQDALVTLVSKPPGLDEESLGGWLHRVTVNRAIDLLRRRRRGREDALSLEGLPGLEAPPPAPRGLALDIERALEKLPEGARLVFVLHDVEGYLHDEIAEKLSISAGTSKSQLFRARELLRRHLHAGGAALTRGVASQGGEDEEEA